MTLHALQLDLVWEDRNANMRKVESLLQTAPVGPGDLLVLPEMCATGFTMNVDAADEGEEKVTQSFLGELCRGYGITILAGIVERSGTGKGRNRAIVLNEKGQRILDYDKIHPFSPGEEDQYYERGKEIALFEWNGLRVAPFICYDLRFPEIFRSAALQGVDLMCVIANWPAKRMDHWITLLRARAIENQCAVVGVNRCGNDPFHIYPGRTMVVDCHGEILVDAGEGEGLITAKLNTEGQREWREAFPALKDIAFLTLNPGI